MVRIKVEYDKYNRVFKLLDRDFGSVLEDGAQYELIVPLMLEIANDEDTAVCISASQLTDLARQPTSSALDQTAQHK